MVAVLAMVFYDFTPSLRHFFKYEVIDGIHVPYKYPIWDTALFCAPFHLNWVSNYKLFFGGGLNDAFDGRTFPIHKNKSSQESNAYFVKKQAHMVSRIIKFDPEDPDPVPGYLFFGNDNWQKILSLFVKENPTMSWFLTAGKDADGSFLELKAYDENDFEKPLHTYYNDFVRMLSESTDFHFVNVRFDTNMTITKITYYDETARKSVTPPKEQWDYWATAALYNVYTISGAANHAVIHIFHYILVTGIHHSTKHDESLRTWAEPYMQNVPDRYLDVGIALAQPTLGPFFNFLSYLPLRKMTESSVLSILSGHDKVITGNEALGPRFTEYAKEHIFKLWGTCQTAEEFINKFLFRDLIRTGGKDLIEEAGILKEFLKITDHIGPYAKEMTRAMKKDNEGAYMTATAHLFNYLRQSSDTGITIRNIDGLIQLLSVTAIVHGSTLSATRLSLRPEVMRWKNHADDKWNSHDRLTIAVLHATNSGVVDGRHVFMHKQPKQTGLLSGFNKWNIDKIGLNLYKVMKKYGEIVEKQKKENKIALLSDPEHLRNYGWILTDWCPDGFDGKQMTVASYI